MLTSIVNFSVRNKLIVILFTFFIAGYGIYALTKIPIGAVPDITNNQVQVITTSRNLSTQDMEQFITYPVELEMSNLPGVEEIRSVTKFGLSVVTIVFEDDMGTFLPRQLIAEKIKSASENIPNGFGTPDMGPITTGLGEIYQYVLDVDSAYKDEYDITELRTIQDWVVRRQLSGIPGVIEVNTWGGFLKQYEVAIKTEKLNAMNISTQDVFMALEKNNNVAGGGYIEKENQAYFIRGEGLTENLEDIRNIVVTVKDGLPVYVKDVAKVGYGSATRFGAITGNGEGEKVLGQIMMLKNANSKKVIDAVNQRVEEISELLPKGVYINPVLDRSELIAKTTFTITENLVLGFLIVIFIVVLLLGNFRSGLVVASVIPLCLLFALSLMYIFGVDANLMSLGAIDFGIIIDGAVIIVEFIAFQIASKSSELSKLSKNELKARKDAITIQSAAKMMNSAIFGQLIILIVFIPILSLSGVEGKMFKPMALTFSFALLGAMVFCFTYVPAVASLILKPSKRFLEGIPHRKKGISSRLVGWLNRTYEPIIDWALKSKKLVLALALVLLVFSIFIFSKMGGEFVPTLDEGDFVIQPVLKTGTSLGKTIETTTQMEGILLEKFPEVKQVVTRIGAAEVPTDPMSMEESDVIITLKPKGEWTSAETKDELADKFKQELSVIPGIGVEFTQPIEMRFNELITGVRSDIAVKIFGENLDLLSKKGNEIKNLIKDVRGAADITVEKIVGLPQMNVKYNRRKIARYGLNIEDLNNMISMGFAGRIVGNMFEGEKMFDLVVRLDAEKRTGLNNLRNLYVDTPSGNKVPLSELADISYQKGAAKISRDNTRRRIVVGINVRDRDLQSVVDDVQTLIENNLELPTGYYITYGGQFENLQSAKSRLLIAVPIALVLIFILLYFAFKSVKEALLIYSAIPLAAVGGILFLWMRGMPFSISAAVGFIALFGIAVLNGIVLIEHFKELQKQSAENIETIIKKGAQDRLRAVLLTAAAAALGFLPMAVSTNAGAEVQRPLATVVIGGLVSSTLLTLLVLPVLYSILISGKKIHFKTTFKSKIGFLLLCLVSALSSYSQETSMNLENLINTAVKNNSGLKSAELEKNKAAALVGNAFNFDKTQVYYQYDQNNLSRGDLPLNVWGIQQDFLFPTVYFSKKSVNQKHLKVSEKNYEIKKKLLTKEVSSAYFTFLHQMKKEEIYETLDSLYTDFARIAQRRFELGETNYLEKITASSKHRRIQIALDKAKNDVSLAYSEILGLIQLSDSVRIDIIPLKELSLNEVNPRETIEAGYYESLIGVAHAEKLLETHKMLPDITLNYFQGTNSAVNGNLFGYQVGVKIPLFFSGNSSRIKALKISELKILEESKEYQKNLSIKYSQLLKEQKKYSKTLAYFQEEGTHLSDQILKTAIISFKNGEIDFFQYIQSLENAYEIQLEYLENLNLYNQVILEINYLNL
ncbi:MAG: CusA/CzcA family heavy metal efflux RND transporter [Pseudozobellia sp.]|nr:CusA/CzcA family heavy metal efflux RND transporter [Pseudozobellia sp.]|tara:strand:- start:1721588 stop:1725940 length:4353 start_codon:yes stop_codon:yes gene_type:complete